LAFTLRGGKSQDALSWGSGLIQLLHGGQEMVGEWQAEVEWVPAGAGQLAERMSVVPQVPGRWTHPGPGMEGGRRGVRGRVGGLHTAWII
jgi:hypothetical protein